MYPDNRWYSHRYILNLYCGNKDKLVMSSIQHGFLTLSLKESFGKLSFPFSKYLVWNKNIGDYLKKNGIKKYEITGSPFLYLHKISKKIKVKTNTFLIFLPHSTHGTPAPHDNYNFAKYINKKFSGKITICVFYKDLNENLKKIFKKFNFKVVTCGLRYNNNYLFKLYELLTSAENIVITEIGTPLFYSLYLNKRTYFIQDYNYKNPLEGYGGSQYLKLLNKYKNKHKFLFKNLPINKIVNKKKGKALADSELGLEYIKTPNKMKKLLYNNNKFIYTFALMFSFWTKTKWFFLEKKLYIQDKLKKINK